MGGIPTNYWGEVLNADSQRPHTKLPFYPWADADGPQAALSQLLADCGAKDGNVSVALDETMRADFALLALDALPGAKRSFLNDTVSFLRGKKDEAEYALLKMNAVLNDGAMKAGFAALKEGVTELQVAKAIRDKFSGAVAEANVAAATEAFEYVQRELKELAHAQAD